MKTLILLTSEFPYGNAETFLENEYPFLRNAFSSIYILTEKKTGICRIELESVNLITIKKNGFSARIKTLINKEFWSEIRLLKKSKKLSRYTFRTAWYSFSKALKIKQAILIAVKNLNKSQLVFYSYWLDEKSLALALIKNRFSNVKCISRAHGWDLHEERHLHNYLPFRNVILEKLNQIFTISNNGKEYLSLNYPNFQDKLKVIRLGTLPINQSYNRFSNDIFQVVSISSIIALKRVDKILQVISKLSNLKIHWTHIGDGDLYTVIEHQAKEIQDANSDFSFSLVGQKTNSEVRQFISENYIDLFINLSETEGIPVTMMEVQSVGIPVLATSVGGTPEIVNHENGILVEKDELNEVIAQKIMDYVYMPEAEKQSKRILSCKNWKENYNAETNYNHFVQTILEF